MLIKIMFPSKRIEKYYHLCEMTLNFSHMSWWIIDLEDNPNYFYCNKTMCDTFVLDPKIIRHSVKKTGPIAGDYNTNIAMQNSKKARLIFDEYFQLKNGEIEEYDNSFPYYHNRSKVTKYFTSRARALLKNKHGKPTVLIGIIEQETISAELYLKSKTDSLTGLNNRREFDTQIEFLLNLAKREKQHISLIMCDVDHFKEYNDILGHYKGDECLVQVAQTIAKICGRSSDIACRYGGEEFSIIFYGSDSHVYLLAETIRNEIQALGIPHPAINNSPVTLSVGYYSLLPNKSTTPRKLIECADKALYKAKDSGRNKCANYYS